MEYSVLISTFNFTKREHKVNTHIFVTPQCPTQMFNILNIYAHIHSHFKLNMSKHNLFSSHFPNQLKMCSSSQHSIPINYVTRFVFIQASPMCICLTQNNSQVTFLLKPLLPSPCLKCKYLHISLN